MGHLSLKSTTHFFSAIVFENGMYRIWIEILNERLELLTSVAVHSLPSWEAYPKVPPSCASRQNNHKAVVKRDGGLVVILVVRLYVYQRNILDVLEQSC
jgi:hypothetical protein